MRKIAVIGPCTGLFSWHVCVSGNRPRVFYGVAHFSGADEMKSRIAHRTSMTRAAEAAAPAPKVMPSPTKADPHPAEFYYNDERSGCEMQGNWDEGFVTITIPVGVPKLSKGGKRMLLNASPANSIMPPVGALNYKGRRLAVSVNVMAFLAKGDADRLIAAGRFTDPSESAARSDESAEALPDLDLD